MADEREQVVDYMLVRQLRAIRELVDNALVMLGEDRAPAPAGPCAHPKEKRRPAGVMGDPNRFFCLECATLVAETLAPDGGT